MTDLNFWGTRRVLWFLSCYLLMRYEITANTINFRMFFSYFFLSSIAFCSSARKNYCTCAWHGGREQYRTWARLRLGSGSGSSEGGITRGKHLEASGNRSINQRKHVNLVFSQREIWIMFIWLVLWFIDVTGTFSWLEATLSLVIHSISYNQVQLSWAQICIFEVVWAYSSQQKEVCLARLDHYLS